MDISQYSKFIALGVETNGSGEVIEVAAVEFSQTGRLLTKPYSRRFNCQSAITVEAVTKHGIRASDLVGCKYYFEMHNDFSRSGVGYQKTQITTR